MNKNTPIYLTTEIRKIEQLAADMFAPTSLMEKAGLAAAKVVRDKLLTSEKNKVLVVAMLLLLPVIYKNGGLKSP
jgi:NAD(P)H-hydrate repair Nnr-like enzyme with NAD(P)H-hydrate epimerase domain